VSASHSDELLTWRGFDVVGALVLTGIASLGSF
jgi:multisubunit Na+/H+ antiporter MnhB subunit